MFTARVNKQIHLQMCQVWFAAAASSDISEVSPVEKHHLLRNILSPKGIPQVSWCLVEQLQLVFVCFAAALG